jgi:hypothetical protein
MTKNDYLIELNNKSVFLGGIKEITETIDPDLITSQVKAYSTWMIVEIKNGVYQGVIQQFYVYNEGEVDEEVYPTISQKQNDPPNPFRDEVRAEADTKITVDRPVITIDQLNEKDQCAICTAYEINVSSEVSSQRYFVWKDDTETFYFMKFLG